MTPEAQRIAISEAATGKRFCVDEGHCFYEVFEQCPQPFDRIKSDGKGYLIRAVVPDYLNDLNAMHEAENVLEESDRADFADCLSAILGLDGWAIWNEQDAFKFAHATATQRAEAFLRTIGKWKAENE